MKRNKFSKALKHLKSKKIDEKLKLLDEQPTNRMSGVYQVTPDTGDGFRMGVGDPDRKFYPKADGTWPSGIPADPSDTLYIRRGGYFDSGKGTVPAVQNITPRDLTYNDVTVNGKTNTDSFIRPSDGKPYTSLPEGTESFILGPLVGNYAINHGYDDFTNLGYIQKDTRQFVLLGRIQGYFDGTAKRSGNARTFDGTASMFTSFNSNFKLEHALWMKDTYLAGNFVDNFPFNFAGGIPVERHPDDNTMGSGSVHGTNEANEGGENDDIGTPQDPPDENDIESLELWGMKYDEENPKPKRSDFGSGRDGRADYERAMREWERKKNEARDEKFGKDGRSLTDKISDAVSNFVDKFKTNVNSAVESATELMAEAFDINENGEVDWNDLGRWVNEAIKSQTSDKFDLITAPLWDALPDKTTNWMEDKMDEVNETILDGLNEIQQNFTGEDMTTPLNWMEIFNKHSKANPNKKSDYEVDMTDITDAEAQSDLSDNVLGDEFIIKSTNKLKEQIGKNNPLTDAQKKSLETFKNFGDDISDIKTQEDFEKFMLLNSLNTKISNTINNNDALSNSMGGMPGSWITNEDIDLYLETGDLTIHKGNQSDDAGYQFRQDTVNIPDWMDFVLGVGDINPDTVGAGSVANFMGAIVVGKLGLNTKYSEDSSGSQSQDLENTPPMPWKFTIKANTSNTLSNSYNPLLESSMNLIKKGDKKKKKIKFGLAIGGFDGNMRPMTKDQKEKFNIRIPKKNRHIFNKNKKQVKESINIEDRNRILREIRQPLKEIKELPKTQKLKGYKPNFKGKFSPQNTPDITASKISDDIVSAKNSSRQVWTAKDKYWKGYETTERMNIIYDNLGFGSQFFDNIAGKNIRLKKDQAKKVQEHLNMLAHQKAMREVYGVREYENKIEESETFDNKVNDPLFTKVAKRLKKEIDYPKKPSPKGYPNEAPPKIDPNTGMHPKYGKRYKYDKLDPISAKTMAGAPTGDPEIDANVKKAAKIKEDWRSDLKNLWLGSEREDWKKKIKEDFANTTQGMKVGQTFTHVPSGQTVTTSGVLGGVETLQTFVPLFGDAVPGPTESQYGLQGFAKPIDIMRRGSTKKAEQLNKELDSSEEYTKKVKADKFMKARVEEKYSEENEMKIVDSLFKSIDEKGNIKDQKVLKKASDYNFELKNNQAELYKRVKEIEEYRVKQAEWEKESERNAKIINSRIQSNISKVKAFVSRYGEKLSDSFPIGSSDVRIAQGGTKLVVISHSGFNYDDSKKFNVRVFDQSVNPETGKKEKIKKIKGKFGYFSGSIADNPFNKTKSSGQATIQYVGVGAEIENRMFEIQDIESKPMPKIPPYLMKNQALGWYNAPQSITSNTKNKIMTGDFARNVLGAVGSLISSIPGVDRQGYEGDIEYAAKLTKDMMDGNLTVDRGPQSKSFNKRLLGLISKNPDRNSVGTSDYADDTINAINELPVRLAIQSFNWNPTEDGILVDDKFDFDLNISGGFLSGLPLGAGKAIQGRIKVVSDAMRMRSVELGFNQVEKSLGFYNNMPSPEFNSTPSDDLMFRSSSDDGAEEAIKKSLASNTSPDGFYKDIKILIPWSQVAKDAPALMSKKPTGSSATKTTKPNDRTGYGYDKKGKLDSSGYGMDPNRDTETEARPLKPSKTVEKIKSVAKTKRKSLSIDEPIVRRKKES